MKQMLISNWQINNITNSAENLDYIFQQNKKHQQNYTFIKPLIAQKNIEVAEILIGWNDYLHYRDDQKMEKIPIYFLPENCTKLQTLEYLIDYFLFDNELNNYIISEILYLFEKINISVRDFDNFISRKLKISTKPKIIEKYKKFRLIKSQILEFLLNKKAPLKLWEYLTEFSEDEQLFFIQLIKITKLSLSNFIEIVANLIEYQKISSVPFTKIFKILNIDNILHDENIENKLQSIREIILLKRYPNLTQHSEEVKKTFSKINQPNNLNLQYDRTFEKKEIRGSFIIKNINDFEMLKKFFVDTNKTIIHKTLNKL